MVAHAAEPARRAATGRPLRLVGSYNSLLYGTVFYFSERRSTLGIRDPQVRPWSEAERLAPVLFCAGEDRQCSKAIDEAAAQEAIGKRGEVELARRYAASPASRCATLS